MLLWQDTFYQVLHERASPIFTGEHSVIFLPVSSQIGRLRIGFGLGLHPYPRLANKNPFSGVYGKG